MSQIKLLHSGGNGVILAAPTSNPSSDVTFKLPQADGTSGQALTTNASGQLAFATVGGGGKILQVVNQSSTTAKTTSGATELEVINLSITPSATTSKIFVIADITVYIHQSGNAICSFRLYRGTMSGTEINKNNAGTDGGNGMYLSTNLNFLDSPSTTSAQTYTMTMKRGSGNTNYIETSGNVYSLTAFEVGA